MKRFQLNIRRLVLESNHTLKIFNSIEDLTKNEKKYPKYITKSLKHRLNTKITKQNRLEDRLRHFS